MAQFAAAHAQATPRQSRADRFLGIHLHELHPHVPLSPPMETTLRPGRPRDYRGAYARIRVRQESQNVADAVKRFGFTFPIAVDSDSDIWNAFHAGGWPMDYLIDKDGNIAYVHNGEGDYAEMEREIQTLLKERNPQLNFASVKYAITRDEDASMMGGICRRESPETYLGFLRGNNIANPGGEDRT